MKKLFVSLFLILSAQQALACDASIEKFSRDCWMQDRLAKLRETYAAKGINLDEIGEYKVLRFIDRNSWEKAKLNEKAPLEIYHPAPSTWQVWENGIDYVFQSISGKNSLYSTALDKETFATINKVLLTDGVTSIKDRISDPSKKPGEFRGRWDNIVGFCVNFDKIDKYRADIKSSEDSMERYLQKWEFETGVRFSDVVEQENGPDHRDASLISEMKMSRNGCNGGKGMFVEYSPSKKVKSQIEWIRIFIKTNLSYFQNNNGRIAPVELAAVVQKWFVSVHPFADGNGRTSRAVQELIMQNFGLPMIPGGDLQNDATEDIEVYIENTYKALDKMLLTLEMCANERDETSISRACRTVKELNQSN